MSVQDLRKRDETRMMLYLVGGVIPLVSTLMGFYLGTFVASQHVIDIRDQDIPKGVVGGIIGFIVSLFIVVGAVSIFPRAVDRDDVARAERQSHPHFQGGHH